MKLKSVAVALCMLPLLLACTDGMGALTGLIPSSDPEVRACRAKERQAAFDDGLNPMQAMQRMQQRCG